jgi:hypothetical protein
MLHHDGQRWRTECERCHAAIEIVGAPDKRRSKKGVEITKAAEFLISLGWNALYRKNAGWSVAWRCKECVERIRNAGMSTIINRETPDMFPAHKKGA